MIKGLGLAVVISTVAMGCGGGSGGSGLNTSVPASTPLNKLSSADATKLCTDTVAYFTAAVTADANSKTFACRIAGVEVALLSFDMTSSTDATLQKACQDTYTACLSAPLDAGAVDVDAGTDSTDCADAQASVSTCSATVGQYSACVDETTAAFQNAFPACNQLTIAKISTFSPDAGANPTSDGPACKTLDAICPGINSDTSMTSSMLSATKSATKSALRAR